MSIKIKYLEIVFLPNVLCKQQKISQGINTIVIQYIQSIKTSLLLFIQYYKHTADSLTYSSRTHYTFVIFQPYRPYFLHFWLLPCLYRQIFTQKTDGKIF